MPESTARRTSSNLPRVETQESYCRAPVSLYVNEIGLRRFLRSSLRRLKNQPANWNESDLVRFMEITLPKELKSDLARAGPLLFRCVQRLGCFPWHNQPCQVHGIDQETLVTAVVILLRRYEDNLHPFVVTTYWSLDNPRAIDGDTQQDQWLNNLLFQCMSLVPGGLEEGHVEEHTVEKIRADQVNMDEFSDDGDSDHAILGMMVGHNYHLLQAHALVSARNRYGSEDDEKRVFRYGPPVVEISELPSSKSQDVRGLIPNDEFKSLLKILLACQLYLCGHGPEDICASGDELDKLTSTAFTGFSQPGKRPRITWDSFNSGLATTVPNLFSALPRLFAPFILDENLDHDSISASTKTEVASMIREAFRQTQSSIEINENGVDDFLLGKLATILPVDLPLQTASVISAVTYEDFDLNPIRDQLQSKDKRLLLLVKGFALDSKGSNLDDTEVIFGAFMPNKTIPLLGRRQNAYVFQLSNTIMAVRYGDIEARYDLEDGVDKIQTQISGNDLAELSFDEETAVARLIMPQSGVSSTIASNIQIASIDLIGFTAANFSVLSITTSALAILVLYQLRPLYFYPTNSLPGIPGAVFDFLWNSSVGLGTPFIAWNVAIMETKNSVAISIAIALSSVFAVAILDVGNLLLWGPVIAWWIAGVLLLSRNRWEVGAWWFRAVLVAKLPFLYYLIAH
ncbi:hypothetical protein VTL71DRAFT_10059 [Oculimacula yallundae]|uniref:Uncharacterized protein n=1 Tax=Oculimacula yallundae TaxID=86028 RepID=A0ABR4BQ91_9HELO